MMMRYRRQFTVVFCFSSSFGVGIRLTFASIRHLIRKEKRKKMAKAEEKTKTKTNTRNKGRSSPSNKK